MSVEIITMTKDDFLLALESFKKQIISEIKKSIDCSSCQEHRRLLDRDGIAKILGVTRTTIDRYRSLEDFPKPIRILKSKPMWDLQDIYNFIDMKKSH
jgi:predicted DNA-binding transcriptional regulator AlpA